MIRSIMATIFAVFLFMGIDTPQLETGQGVKISLASVLVPAANAEKEPEKSKPAEESKESEEGTGSEEATGSEESDATDTPTGPWMCTALATVQTKHDESQKVEKEKADKEKEAKESKDEADAKKAKDEDDDSVSKSKKEDDDKKAKEKDDEFEKAKKEHDDAKSKLDDAEKELKAAKTAMTTSPCTTVSGQPGYWSNAAGTPKPTTSTTTAPKSLREMHGQ